jgi:hypothetical protein
MGGGYPGMGGALLPTQRSLDVQRNAHPVAVGPGIAVAVPSAAEAEVVKKDSWKTIPVTAEDDEENEQSPRDAERQQR